MSTLTKRITLSDGAKLAYEVLGERHIGTKEPLVLVTGLSGLGDDWDRLSTVLATIRPVLVFDNRGMGKSSYSTPSNGDQITVESMARDLLELVAHLGWTEIALCGFSMGGVIAQQLIFLPFHPTNPTSLPFRVTHLILAATMAEVVRVVGKFPPVPKQKLTIEEKRELVAKYLPFQYDPLWVQQNPDRFSHKVEKGLHGRPSVTFVKQYKATGKFNLEPYYAKIPKDLSILVIHGKLDDILPYSCGELLLRRIPQAKLVEVGSKPGQVPSDQYGHIWFEYFDISVWRDVFENFLNDSGGNPCRARL